MKPLINKQSGLLFISSVLILFLSFNFNFFHAVSPVSFGDYQNDSEALVIGRLVKTHNDGVFSSQGIMGRYMDLEGDFNHNQTKLYLGKLSGGRYEEYLSQIGLQGIILSQADIILKKLNFEPTTRLALYHSTTALLFALTLSIIILILYFDIGIEAACFLLIAIALSKWPVYNAKNLYWMTYTLFLPTVTVLIATKLEDTGRKFNIILVSLLVMLFVFIKSAMGYEYISSVLLAMLAPLVYFASKNSWPLKKLVQRSFIIGTFGMFGFIFAIVLHIQQLTIATGSMSQATSFLEDRVLTRTQSDPESFANTPFYESQKASVLSVIFNKYMLRGGSFRLKIPFLIWIGVFMFITYKVYKGKYASAKFRMQNPVLKALIITTWFSILAPLSWIVLAKSHSFIHAYINLILWHLPFMIFGFALLGYILSPKIQNLFKRIQSLSFKHAN